MMGVCTPISSVEELQQLREQPSGEYCLDASLSMMEWIPIPYFDGVLNGNGHTLSIALSDKELLAGLFAQLSGRVINLHLDVSIPGQEAIYSGGLAAVCDGCTVTNVKVSTSLNTLAERGSGYLFGLVITDHPASSEPFQDVYHESVSPRGLQREGRIHYLNDETTFEIPDIVPLKDHDDIDSEGLVIGLIIFTLIVALAIVLCVVFICGCCCTTCCCCTCPLGLLQKRAQSATRLAGYSSSSGNVARIHEPGYEVMNVNASANRSPTIPPTTELTKFPLPETRILY